MTGTSNPPVCLISWARARPDCDAMSTSLTCQYQEANRLEQGKEGAELVLRGLQAHLIGHVGFAARQMKLPDVFGLYVRCFSSHPSPEHLCREVLYTG